MKVTLFVPCFIDLVSPQVGVAMVNLLEKLGHTLEYPEKLTCCGQPPFNSGYWEEARRVARPVLERLQNAEAVVIGSGSCGAMLKKFYPDLFAGQPEAEAAQALSDKCWEFSEFLVNKLGVTSVGAKFPHRVTIHDGCHGLRELNGKQPIRKLLQAVEGLELVEMKEAETCCGFGGTFATKFPMISTAMGEVKCASAAETCAEFMVSNDSSCLLHLRGLMDRTGQPLPTRHVAEILMCS